MSNMNSMGGQPIPNVSTTVFASPATSQYVLSNVSGGASSTTWTTYPSKTDYEKLEARVIALEERFAILQPNETMQEKYPALREAYEAYKIIEKLVSIKGPDETDK